MDSACGSVRRTRKGRWRLRLASIPASWRSRQGRIDGDADERRRRRDDGRAPVPVGNARGRSDRRHCARQNRKVCAHALGRPGYHGQRVHGRIHNLQGQRHGVPQADACANQHGVGGGEGALYPRREHAGRARRGFGGDYLPAGKRWLGGNGQRGGNRRRGGLCVRALPAEAGRIARVHARLGRGDGYGYRTCRDVRVGAVRAGSTRCARKRKRSPSRPTKFASPCPGRRCPFRRAGRRASS